MACPIATWLTVADLCNNPPTPTTTHRHIADTTYALKTPTPKIRNESSKVNDKMCLSMPPKWHNSKRKELMHFTERPFPNKFLTRAAAIDYFSNRVFYRLFWWLIEWSDKKYFCVDKKAKDKLIVNWLQGIWSAGVERDSSECKSQSHHDIFCCWHMIVVY